MTPKSAKDFFLERVQETAWRNKVDFDDLERKMMYWSAENEDLELGRKFSEKHNDGDYEKKIENLLEKSYSYDRKNDLLVLDKYKEAYKALKEGDHYLLIMLRASIGGRLNPYGWLRFGGETKSVGDFISLVFWALIVGLALMAFFYLRDRMGW